MTDKDGSSEIFGFRHQRRSRLFSSSTLIHLGVVFLTLVATIPLSLGARSAFILNHHRHPHQHCDSCRISCNIIGDDIVAVRRRQLQRRDIDAFMTLSGMSPLRNVTNSSHHIRRCRNNFLKTFSSWTTTRRDALSLTAMAFCLGGEEKVLSPSVKNTGFARPAMTIHCHHSSHCPVKSGKFSTRSRGDAPSSSSFSSLSSSSSNGDGTFSSTSLGKNYNHHEKNELPPTYPRYNDVQTAIKAVRNACFVASRLQPLYPPTTTTTTTTTSSNNNDSPKHQKSENAIVGRSDIVTKSDTSPVTIADLAAQAIVLNQLHSKFPNDLFIAEESGDTLRSDPILTRRTLEAVMMMIKSDQVDDDDGTHDSHELNGIIANAKELMYAIDLGQSYEKSIEKTAGGTLKRRRVWVLDPIDGTRGFLRGKHLGGQYCVALALLEDGVPTIGVMGCPNLPTAPNDERYEWDVNETDENNSKTRGCIFVASKGGGCYQLPLFPMDSYDDDDLSARARRVHVTPNDGSVMSVSDARFCVGIEKYSDALGQFDAMAKILHGPDALDESGQIIKSRRMDSQVKYGVLARGGAEIYLRLPKPGYVEWIWDHAAGSVVIEEAGGEVTDVDGNRVDFSLGAKLSHKVRGIAGSNGGMFHDALLDAYHKQENERNGPAS